MLATLRAAPASGDDLATEWKWDGQRATVIVTGPEVRVLSRNGADITRTFPELASVADAVGQRPLVLDGEIVALDPQGVPSFTRLQQRWPQQRRPTPALLREVPVRLMGFDIVELEGRRITDRPWVERRQALDSVVVDERSRVLTVPKAFTGVSPVEMLAVAAAHRMEGIVLKPVDSPYVPGRSGIWTKVPVRSTAEVVIAGFWRAGGPGGRGSIGSLLLAGHDENDRLVAVGQVGTGFSASMRRHLFSLLDPIVQPRSPLTVPVEADGVRWVTPQYVGEVAYREYVDGHWLRHPSWKGLRERDIRAIRLPVTSSAIRPACG